ncbi:MAG: F0F1 ATP synthase subunit B [Buchnera aphidicola (Chaetogeoica yunlongensis)]
MDFNATIIGQALSFILFIFFCMKYIWPTIISKIEIRQKEIQDELFFVQQSKEEIKNYKKKVESEIKLLKQEASNIIDLAVQEKIKILDKARLNAEIEKKIILDQAYKDIELEYQKVRDELRQRVSQIAIDISRKIIDCSIHEVKKNDTISSLIEKI